MNRYEEERQKLEDILSSQEFTQYAKPEEEGRNLLLILLERLFEALEKLFPQIQLAEGSGSAIAYLLIVVGFVALFAIIVFLLRMVWVERRVRQRKAIVRHDELEQAPVDLASRARAAAEAGDTREATRLLFLALLLGFQQQGLLRVEAWKTNWEYAAELEERGSAWIPLFRESALMFDAVWYGGRAIALDEYEAWSIQVESALSADAGGGTA